MDITNLSSTARAIAEALQRRGIVVADYQTAREALGAQAPQFPPVLLGLGLHEYDRLRVPDQYTAIADLSCRTWTGNFTVETEAVEAPSNEKYDLHDGTVYEILVELENVPLGLEEPIQMKLVWEGDIDNNLKALRSVREFYAQAGEWPSGVLISPKIVMYGGSFPLLDLEPRLFKALAGKPDITPTEAAILLYSLGFSDVTERG